MEEEHCGPVVPYSDHRGNSPGCGHADHEVRHGDWCARTVLPMVASCCLAWSRGERVVAATCPDEGAGHGGSARADASGVGHRKLWALTRYDGHAVSQATGLRVLHEEGLVLPADYSGNAAN